jgi:hypothetical protein
VTPSAYSPSIAASAGDGERGFACWSAARETEIIRCSFSDNAVRFRTILFLAAAKAQIH